MAAKEVCCAKHTYSSLSLTLAVTARRCTSHGRDSRAAARLLRFKRHGFRVEASVQLLLEARVANGLVCTITIPGQLNTLQVSTRRDRQDNLKDQMRSDESESVSDCDVTLIRPDKVRAGKLPKT